MGINIIAMILTIVIVSGLAVLILKMIYQNKVYKLNDLIIQSYVKSTTMTQEEIFEMGVQLVMAEGIAKQKYIDTARVFLNLREKNIRKGIRC